jgi:hypothetical protein
MSPDLERLLGVTLYQAFDTDRDGQILAGSDESGSTQLIEISPDGARRNGVAFDPVIRDLATGAERTISLGDALFALVSPALVSPAGPGPDTAPGTRRPRPGRGRTGGRNGPHWKRWH